MAYSEFLADNISRVLLSKNVTFVEKKMMGGLAFMVDDKMCVGVTRDDMMVRVDPEIYESVVGTKESREMDFTGRAMRGFLFVGPAGTEDDMTLTYWIDLALEYNPRAKSSKKKK